MALASPNRREPETTAEFMARRAREKFARLTQDASAAAHDAYGKAIRAGENLRLPTTDDVITYGADLMSGRGRPKVSAPPPSPRARPVAGPATQRRAPQARKPASPPPPASSPQWLDELNRNPYAKFGAGYAGLIAGQIPGAARGLKHMAEGVIDTATFVGRAMNPQLDQMTSLPGHRVSDQVLDTGRAVASYANRVRKNPSRLGDDMGQFGRHLNADLNPFATPSTGTALGEFQRLYDVGQNQGELALNIAALPIGGEAVAAAGIGRASRLAKATRYLVQSGQDDAAKYLALPYKGKGHHAAIPERSDMPKLLGGGPWPRWIADSPFGVVQFKNLTKGEAYVKHAEIDPYARGARLANNLSARGWSANKAGIETQRGLQRIWNGTPEATKSVLGGVVGGTGGIIHEPLDKERPW